MNEPAYIFNVYNIMAAVRLIGSFVYIFGMAGSRLGGQGGGQEAARGGLGAAWGRPGGGQGWLGMAGWRMGQPEGLGAS